MPVDQMAAGDRGDPAAELTCTARIESAQRAEDLRPDILVGVVRVRAKAAAHCEHQGTVSLHEMVSCLAVTACGATDLVGFERHATLLRTRPQKVPYRAAATSVGVQKP